MKETCDVLYNYTVGIEILYFTFSLLEKVKYSYIAQSISFCLLIINVLTTCMWHIHMYPG